jgi:arylsulfatase A-like enzyme
MFRRARAALLPLLLASSACAADAPTRPNFVFVISDDHRWDCLGAAGNKAIRTPVLDKLAAEGVWFRQGTNHVPQCSPTRSSLLTGLPPHANRWYSNQSQHPDVRNADGFRGLPTLPGMLNKAGYRTVLIGKWDLNPEPWNCGFSDVRVWMPRGGGPYRDPKLAGGNSRQSSVHKGYTQEIFADDAIAFLESDAATDKPFFLWLAFTAPHAPHTPVPERIAKHYADKTGPDLLPPNFPDATATAAPWKIYYESISHLDEQVGRVLAALDERKLTDKTVVVFLGDNGYMMRERNWDGKVLPYESSVRVPFLIRAPGVAVLQGASDVPVSSLDLPTTFLRLVRRGAAAGMARPRPDAGAARRAGPRRDRGRLRVGRQREQGVW